jgi:Acetate kinase
VAEKNSALKTQHSALFRVLVLNSGSSSLKFRLLDISSDHRIITSLSANPSTQHPALSTVVSGSIVGIGHRASLHIAGNATVERDIHGYDEAARWVFEQLDMASIQAVGHRIVHGGERFSQPVRVTDAVIAELEQLNELAPLHNPPGLAVIRARALS